MKWDNGAKKSDCSKSSNGVLSGMRSQKCAYVCHKFSSDTVCPMNEKGALNAPTEGVFMRRFAALSLLAATFALPSIVHAAPKAYTIDVAHSSANFKVRHLAVSNVRGTINDMKGDIVIDEADITKSRFNATLNVASIDTGIKKRDDHLRSPDFFAASKHPTITFNSTRTFKKKDGTINIVGKLTIRGTTKVVVLEVEELTPEGNNPFKKGGKTRGVVAHTTINRQDFGLGWNKVTEGVAAVGDTVKIELELELHSK